MRSAALALLAASTVGARPLRVDLDARLELAGAADWLAEPKSSATPDALDAFPYARELSSRLPVPSAPELISSRPAWSSDERDRLLLSLSPLPALKPLDAVDDSDVELARGSNELWLAALRAYAHASNFDAVFNASRYLLDADAARVRRRLAAEGTLRAYESYAGLGPPELVLILLSPFASAGPAPAHVKILDDGTASLTLVVGPEISTSAPSGLDFWSGRLPAALWNEAAQLELEPLMALYADRVAQSSRLATALGERCARDWRRCALDQAALAVTLRLTARRYGKSAAAAYRLRLEGGTHSPVLTALLVSLERYERATRGAKAPGSGLADYFPELLAALALDDPTAAPAPPRLPDASSLSPGRRRRLAAFLKAAAPRTRNPRLKALAAAAPAWERDAERELPALDARDVPVLISTAASAADGLRNRGIEEFGAGKPEAALADFQAALSSSPRDAQTLASEAAVLASLGRDDDALAAYDSALAAARAQGSPRRLVSDLLSSREETRRRRDARKAPARRRP